MKWTKEQKKLLKKDSEVAIRVLSSLLKTLIEMEATNTFTYDEVVVLIHEILKDFKKAKNNKL